MHFLLQGDGVTIVEKRTVRLAALMYDWRTSLASLQYLCAGHLNEIDASVVPVGTVEFVQEFARQYNIHLPVFNTYPPCLHGLLRREVREMRLGDVRGDVFVKPQTDVKRFTGGMVCDIPAGLPADLSVWVSEPVDFVSEWRYYVLNGVVVGAGRYDDGDDDAPAPDEADITDAVRAWSSAGAPAGYSLDFGVTRQGNTALVEANDGWSLGFYKGSCSNKNYAQLLHARWLEIVLHG